MTYLGRNRELNEILNRMNCKADVKICSPEAMLEIKHNLDDVIQQAGGSVSCFSIEKLKEMSAFDLLNSISTNSIRFVYKKGQ